MPSVSVRLFSAVPAEHAERAGGSDSPGLDATGLSKFPRQVPLVPVTWFYWLAQKRESPPVICPDTHISPGVEAHDLKLPSRLPRAQKKTWMDLTFLVRLKILVLCLLPVFIVFVHALGVPAHIGAPLPVANVADSYNSFTREHGPKKRCEFCRKPPAD